jgi:ABC-type phosphate transport system substrate-binding protein
MFKRLTGIVLFMVAFGLLLGSSFVSAAEKELIGAGATFPQPLYSKMFDAYFQQNKIKGQGT